MEALEDYITISYPKDENNLGRIDVLSVIDLSEIMSFQGNPETHFNIGKFNVKMNKRYDEVN
jgi:hypothetical protein